MCQELLPFTGPEHAVLRCRAAITNRHELLLYPAWCKSPEGGWQPLPLGWAQRVCISNFPGDEASFIYDAVITGELDTEDDRDMLRNVLYHKISYGQPNLMLTPVSLNAEPCFTNVQLEYANCIHRVVFEACPLSMFKTDAQYYLRYLDGTEIGPFYPLPDGDCVELVPLYRLDEGRGYVYRNAKNLTLVSKKVLLLDSEGNVVLEAVDDEEHEDFPDVHVGEQQEIADENPAENRQGQVTRALRRNVATPVVNYVRKRTGNKDIYVLCSMKGLPFRGNGRGYNLSCSSTVQQYGTYRRCCWFDVKCEKLDAFILNGEKWFFDIDVEGIRSTYSCPVEQLRKLPTKDYPDGRSVKTLYINVDTGCVHDMGGDWVGGYFEIEKTD